MLQSDWLRALVHSPYRGSDKPIDLPRLGKMLAKGEMYTGKYNVNVRAGLQSLTEGREEEKTLCNPN